jgi:hypothetical protein
MRITLSNILLFVYFIYLLMASFPAFTFCVYRNIASIGHNIDSEEFQTATGFSDLNYLRAIKERAGVKDKAEQGTPQKISVENIVITCIIQEKFNLDPALWNTKSKNFLYLSQYIDNFPEVAVPPPKSA